ncbi:protein ELYS-like [Phaenicophaeus curvirostris]|uniref:protein ELYS-like n=1 Tax=Phaenicophaeus curvirostris TaxID=33595 RepID=UPI0037F0CF65
MKTLEREHHCRLGGRRIPVYVVTLQEPENDPHNCCYLWAVQSTQESKGDALSLHLMRLTFGDRKRLACGQVMYEGLEGCKERFSLDLASQICPRRRQTSNIKLLSCQTMEDFYDCVDKEGNTNEDGVCLLRSGVVHVTCTGFQKEEEQLEAMLSAAVQTGSLELLTGCIKHWTSESKTSKAAFLGSLFQFEPVDSFLFCSLLLKSSHVLQQI